ncbi:hypothetical protein [uncultured Desulfuromusa sp.]|uniref:hypothetical protein n=1 Tax=uncultured Desulfuromusa sp. TaxID=219183 RepID=UPI002AA80694|nr:hypothetical protein [uncultured Desulfuromusa sp.]
MNAADSFKTCPCCGFTWASRKEFLDDPTLDLNGYQVSFKNLEEGMFLFTHNIEPCRSTMTIMMGEFRDLYAGEMYEENKTDSDECPAYCLHKGQLSRCAVRCECAFAREVLHIVKERLNEAKAFHQFPTPPT